MTRKKASIPNDSIRLVVMGLLKMNRLTLHDVAKDVGMSYSHLYYRLYNPVPISGDVYEEINKSLYKHTGWTIEDAIEIKRVAP